MIVALLALALFTRVSPERALGDAVAASPDVAAARARTREAAAAVEAARGVLVPSLTGGYVQAPQGNPPGPDVVSRLASVGLQTNVADFVAYGATVRENVLLLEASRDDAFVTERAERIKTAGLYFDALKARAIVAARTRALDLANAQREAAQKRFTAGDGPRLDLVRADVALARATADLEIARGDDADATEALALETGHDPSDFSATAEAADPAAGAAGTDADPDPDPAAAVAAALGARAEVASARAAAHAEEAARRAVAAGSFPALLVGGGYTAGTDSGVPVGAPSIDVALTLPLGPGATARAHAEDAKLAEAQAKVENANRSIALEVGAAARAVGSLRRAALAASRGRAAAELELAATTLGYAGGATSSLDVRSAQAAYAQALVDERAALYDVAKARAVLALETGR